MAVRPLTFSDLPETLPVFPLTGALLLPGGELPLNIFEPRYLAMFNDAMATPHRLIGMVQSRPDEKEMGSAALYSVGCAGRLTAFSETGDGRLLVTLSGLIRFDILDELPLHEGGYRRVRADFLGYDGDLERDEPACTREAKPKFIESMRSYFQAQGFDTDWDAVEKATVNELLVSLAMACPFSAAEKQALLEAPTRTDALKTLEGLLIMGAMEAQDQTH